MATLKDIAQKTGLSTASVSLVLRGKPNRLSEESRSLILRTAKEMNYRPNKLAVSLAGSQSHTIGLLVPDVKNMFFAELVQGVEEIAYESGYSILLSTTRNHYCRILDSIEDLASRQVDAIIVGTASIIPASEIDELCALLKSLKIPIILLDYQKALPGFSTVSLDHYTGAFMATEHLIKLGHREIACISGPTNSSSSAARLRGFYDALTSNKIPADKDLVYTGDYLTESGYQAAKEILKKPYTAVFACNDMMAFGAYRCFKDNNISVPHDISLVGFDNTIFSTLLDVPLTTISQPAYDIGKEATKQVVCAIETHDVSIKKTLFEPQIIVRESTAPPKNVKMENEK